MVEATQCFQRLDGQFCGLATDFMGAIIKPLDYWFFNSFGVLFWGMILFITWRHSGNSLYAGIMGIVVASGMMVANNEVLGIGLILLVLSGTVAVYHMFISKTGDR